ncbi:MAG: hypothetical protein JO012_21460 [Hyphomicrobiales bacterium]|nr:hypothetical protein [Hyphomicrobiales bacterium]
MKTAKAELQRRKAAAAEQDQRRAEIEAKIAQGRVKLIEWEEAVVRTLMGETLPDDCLVAAPPFSPAMQFLMDRVRDVHVDQFDAAWRRAMIDLLQSDVPLDKGARGHVAGELWRLTNPEAAKKTKLRAKLEFIESLRAEAARRGETLEKADDEIAKNLKHSSGPALRRWMQRTAKVLCGEG